jgi:hypothetical protein
MSEKKLSIVYNLESLSEQQREQYKRDVSEFFGLNPDTNWFDILWIADEGTGMKKLQLYARRGTTDVLRGQRGIDVLSLTQHDGPGYVSFTAVGRDKNGRQEIAVGAHSTEGLKGEKLAAAVATAETRAGRRLTLKFVGLGILDYSEVNQDAPISAPAPDAQLASTSIVFPPMPKISPNPAPGKDVTLPGDVKPVMTNVPALPATSIIITDGALAMALGASGVIPGSPRVPSMQEMRDEATRQLALGTNRTAPQPVSLEAPVSAAVETPQNSETPAPKVRKPRGPNKKRNTVDMSSPGQVSVAVPVDAQAVLSDPKATPAQQAAAHATAIVYPPAAPAAPIAATVEYHVPLPPHVGTAVVGVPVSDTSVPNQGTDFPGKPTKEQEEGYRVFLREYANNILPAAGMRPSEGIGGASAKLRLFAERMAGKPTSQMTVDDWEDFKAFFPGFLANNPPKNLVIYINDSIGAK